MRRLVRWAFRLFFLLLVIVVAGILLRNTMAKESMESSLRAGTGMDARIGGVDIGLLNPTVTIENLRLYNPPDFGGSLFLDLPELHVEYDPFAFRKNELHFKLVRLNLAEISIVQDQKGRLNVQSLGERNRHAGSRGKSPLDRFKFTGIDTLNLSLGKLKTLNLATKAGRETDFNIRNDISHNVKSSADLAGLNFILMARSGVFANETNSPLDFSRLLGTLLGR